MLNLTPAANTIYQDSKMSVLMSALQPNEPLRISLNGRRGILMDEAAYEGLLETILILQENPGIVQELNERETGDFIDEAELRKYV